MIETLPLLPATWAEWDWSKSNGNSTIAQMNQGYNAILNQGYCSSFSRFIWNDLVDSVSSMLSAAGQSWDNTYCGMSECKIHDPLGVFTAEMFNSVALNIYRFGFVTWKWAVSNLKKGYVGRDAFKGYSDSGAAADTLYGWYFLELTDKFNRVIQVLKGQGSLCEFDSSLFMPTDIDTLLFSAAAGVMDYNNQIVSHVKTPLERICVSPLKADEIDFSYQSGALVTQANILLNTKAQSLSDIYAQCFGCRVGAADSNCISQTVSNVRLMPLVFVGYMRYADYIKSNADASLEPFNLSELKVKNTSLSHVYAPLSCALPFLVKAISVSNTNCAANTINIKSFPICALPFMATHVFCTPVLKTPNLLSCIAVSQSILDCILDRIYPLYIQRSIGIKSYDFSLVDMLPGSRMTSFTKSSSDNVSDIVCKGMRTFLYSGISNTSREAIINTVLPWYIDSSQTSNTYGDFTINNVLGIYFISVVHSKSKISGSMQIREPLTVASSTVARTREKVKTNSVKAYPLLSSTKSDSHCVAPLELYSDKPVSDWYDPVRTGNNLYIRSAYYQAQHDSGVCLDAGVYYDPVRTGNDLYVRSVNSLKEGFENE